MAMVYVDEIDPATNRAKPEKRLGSVCRYGMIWILYRKYF